MLLGKRWIFSNSSLQMGLLEEPYKEAFKPKCIQREETSLVCVSRSDLESWRPQSSRYFFSEPIASWVKEAAG